MLSYILRKMRVLPEQPRPIVSIDEANALISRVRQSGLSYCGAPKLENLVEAIGRVQSSFVPGAYIEAGVALGGSAILIASLKPRDVALHLYDVFEMIPPPGERDGQDAHDRYMVIKSGQSKGLKGKQYYGYQTDLLSKVKTTISSYGIDETKDNIHYHVGLFENTLRPMGPIAFAHVDADWYDSVNQCLQGIAHHLSVGGIMVFDDYSSYSGCKRAVDEFLAANPHYRILFHRRSIGLIKLGR